MHEDLIEINFLTVMLKAFFPLKNFFFLYFLFFFFFFFLLKITPKILPKWRLEQCLETVLIVTMETRRISHFETGIEGTH